VHEARRAGARPVALRFSGASRFAPIPARPAPRPCRRHRGVRPHARHRGGCKAAGGPWRRRISRRPRSTAPSTARRRRATWT